MNNKNYNNDHESFMEGIYGCLERIETAVIEMQKIQPNEGNTTVPNVDNTALVQEIKTLVENATGTNCKYTERKIQELTKTLSENLGVVNDNVKGVSGKNKPDFVAIQNEFANLKKLTTSLIPMIEESKVLHRENDYNFNLNFNSKLDWFMLTLNTIFIAFLASAYYFESQRNKDEEDDSLKYRYIKMKGEASAEQIATLEDIFELNRDAQKIEQMREDVETYEEAVRKQAALAEQARLKEQAAKEQESKAKSIKNKQDNSNVNHNKSKKPDCDMATVKIKFRPSTVDGGQGSIFYQVIHNRVARQQKTGYRLYGYEWNNHLSEVILPKFNENRKRYLSEINDKIRMDVKQLQKVITDFEHSGCKYTADDVIEEFISDNPKNFLFPFMEGVIANLKLLGKIRTSETYTATLCSFKHFRKDKDLALDDMDSDMMISYETYLRNNGVSPNSSSFYMRNLRAVYNRAVEKNLTTQRYPFKHVYTGVDKTIKRAVPLKVVKQIKEMDFSMNPTFDFARNMFLLSFYTRGMSFVDMAYLRKKDLQNGVLSYRRRKTGQQLFIKWEKCMQEIVNKYDTSQSNYLLPIIKPFSQIDERKQYIYAAHNINRCLKIIGKELELSVSLTLYVARHAWASIAKSKNIPLSVISEGMGHDSEATTRIYLASLDTMAIDKANSMILKSL